MADRDRWQSKEYVLSECLEDDDDGDAYCLKGK